MPGYIHHIEWCVSQLDHLSDQLVSQFGFRVIAERHVKLTDHVEVKQLVLKSGLTQFMLTEKKTLESRSRLEGQKNRLLAQLQNYHTIYVLMCHNNSLLCGQFNHVEFLFFPDISIGCIYPNVATLENEECHVKQSRSVVLNLHLNFCNRLLVILKAQRRELCLSCSYMLCVSSQY